MVEDDLVHREGNSFGTGRRLPAAYFRCDVGVSHWFDLPVTLRAFEMAVNHVVLADRVGTLGLGKALDLIC